MKQLRFSSLLLMMMPFSCYAAAGFADAYHDHQQWIFPAYSYCLIFGLLCLLGMFIISLIWKSKTQEITSSISFYLRKLFQIIRFYNSKLLSLQGLIRNDKL